MPCYYHLHRHLDLLLLATLLVEVDQTRRRRVVVHDLALLTQLGQDVLGEHLTQFDAHLIVRVDTPDSALNMNLVLVKGDQGTKSLGCQFLEHDRVGRLVTGKDLGLDECVVLAFLWSELFHNLLLGLTEREGLGLGEEVGEQDLVVLAVCDRVQGLDRSEEITRDQLGTLVDELIESVLAVGSGLSPDDRSSLVVDLLAGLGDALSIGFHVSLLEVVSELVEVLVVREQSLGLRAVEVIVPDTDEGKDYGQVLLERGLLEVQVHLVGTEEELLKVVVSDGEADGETDSGPERVSTTDPVPELEHVGLGDTELGDSGGVGGQGDKVLGDVRLFLGRLEEPLLGTLGVGDRFLGGESLGGDDE